MQTTELLATERIRSASLLIRPLAERFAAASPAAPAALAEVRASLDDARENTFFELLTVVDANGVVLAQDGDSAL